MSTEPFQPPQSLDAERAVLGALLLAGDKLPLVVDRVHADDFVHRRHQIVYRALAALCRRNEPVDFITVQAELEHAGELGAAGGIEFVVELASGVTSAARLDHHVGIVLAASDLRRTNAAGGEVAMEALHARLDPDDVDRLLDAAISRFTAIASRDNRATAIPIQQLLGDSAARLRDPALRSANGLPTGFNDLDRLTGGLRGGELIVVAARPSIGKSAFLTAITEHVTADSGPDRKPIALVFSLEMGASVVVDRVLCARARIDGFLRSGDQRSDAELRRLECAVGDMQDANVLILEAPALTTNQIRSCARRVKHERGLDLVVVDYLQLIATPPGETRQVEVGRISSELKSLARDLNVPVVVAAQLSRKVEDRDPQIPVLSDLRESGAIEQDADVVLLLYRLEYYAKYSEHPEHKGMADIIVSKHRNGPTGSIRLRFDKRSMRFDTVAAAEVLVD